MDDAEYEELEWLHHDEASDALAVVVTNCPPAKAPAIARALVERRVAACVNIDHPGIQSVYQWEGQLHMEAETTPDDQDRAPQARRLGARASIASSL